MSVTDPEIVRRSQVLKYTRMCLVFTIPRLVFFVISMHVFEVPRLV